MTGVLLLIGDFLIALPIYLINGILATIYFLADSGPILLCSLSAFLIIRYPDRRLQSRANFRPGRTGRTGNSTEFRTAQISTGLILGLWIICQWGMGAPVPWLGACMWFFGSIIVLLVHTQEHTLFWNIKSGLVLYALAVAGSRLYLSYTAQLTSDQWAALIGSSESAATVIASTRGNVTTIILWALWLVIPLGYFAMLLQNVLIHPISLVNPLAGLNEIIERYRTRR